MVLDVTCKINTKATVPIKIEAAAAVIILTFMQNFKKHSMFASFCYHGAEPVPPHRLLALIYYYGFARPVWISACLIAS